MHEMGLAQGIVAVVEDIAGDATVRHIRLRVGAAQAVAGDSLEFNFALLTEGTPMQGARLDVAIVDGDGVFIDEIALADGEVIRHAALEVVEPVHDRGQHRHPAWN